MPDLPMQMPLHILVFKTNLRFKKDSVKIKPCLDRLKEIRGWNIDRDDPEYILRIESKSLCQNEIIEVIKQAGYYCEELND